MFNQDTLTSKISKFQLPKDIDFHQILHYANKFENQPFLFKISGSMLFSNEMLKSFAENIVKIQLLGIKPIIVHGGGKQIDENIIKNNQKPKFKDGLRVTDKETITIVQNTLNEIGINLKNSINEAYQKIAPNFNILLNKQIATIENDIVEVAPLHKKYKFVGSFKKANISKIKNTWSNNKIPIISSIGKHNDTYYNVNADDVACGLSADLKCKKLHFISNVDGIYDNKEKINKINITLLEEKIKNGIITEGMIPKAKACIKATSNGIESHIFSGEKNNALLYEIFTDSGVGTMILN